MPNCPTPCPTCPRRYRPLPGDGALPSRFLAISDFPGREENAAGRVQVGKGGRELCETYMPLANLRRRDFHLTNVQQCFPGDGKTADKNAVRDCGTHHLPWEIEHCAPEVIFLMGGTATKLCRGIDMDAMHGIPQHTDKVGDVLGWRGWVVPMYNPAFGLREGRSMTPLLEDWANVMRELDSPGDPEPPETDYRMARTAEEVDAYMGGTESGTSGGVDTEDHGGVPYSVQVSIAPGTGIFIPSGCTEALIELNNHTSGGLVSVFHHAGHDIEVLRHMGVRVGRYRDTMQEAFQLGNLPQGLKDLTYRLFRITMSSWKENVRPASIAALQDWLVEASLVARLDLCNNEVKTYKKCVCDHLEKSHGTKNHDAKCACREYIAREELIEFAGPAQSLFARLLKHTDVDSDYDPWERLNGFWAEAENESDAMHLESRVGKFPILGIGNCSEAQAIRYAVGDSDWTAQVATELKRRRQESRFDIAEGDEDQ